MLKLLALRIIRAYRNTGGGIRWFGIDCNFEPSCSAYAEEAIARFGFREGVRLTWSRLRRCNQPDSVCKCLEPVPDIVRHGQTNHCPETSDHEDDHAKTGRR